MPSRVRGCGCSVLLGRRGNENRDRFQKVAPRMWSYTGARSIRAGVSPDGPEGGQPVEVRPTDPRAPPRCERVPSHPLPDVTLTLVGISHHRAPIELRERVAFDLDGSRALAERLGHESVVVSTCNRTELYLAGDPANEERAVEILTTLAGDRRDTLTTALYRLRDEAVGMHLFRVAAG